LCVENEPGLDVLFSQKLKVLELQQRYSRFYSTLAEIALTTDIAAYGGRLWCALPFSLAHESFEKYPLSENGDFRYAGKDVVQIMEIPLIKSAKQRPNAQNYTAFLEKSIDISI
jgi:hypothetical protein